MANNLFIDNGDFYDNLRYAILNRACEDYEMALKNKDKGEIRRLDKFFEGDWCDTLCGKDGLGKKIRRLIVEKTEGEQNDKNENDML